jgi:hypothetical protein
MNEMNRRLRGLPEPEPGDEPQETTPLTASEWFDSVFRRPRTEQAEDDRDSE